MKRLILFALVVVATLALATPVGATEDIVFERFPQPADGTHFENDFGFARRGHRHRGNDIFGQKGDPVVAVAGGIVTTISSGSTAGNYVVVEHIGGWETWYLHLNNDTPGTDNGRLGPEHAIGARVEVGWYIPAGAIVGFVGDSGNAEGTEPHTHFEIHVDGKVVNPYPYLIETWVLSEQLDERAGAVL